MSGLIDWLIDRLQEPSTKLGIGVVLAGAVGLETDNKLVGDVAEGVTLLLGGALIYYKEWKAKREAKKAAEG